MFLLHKLMVKITFLCMQKPMKVLLTIFFSKEIFCFKYYNYCK